MTVDEARAPMPVARHSHACSDGEEEGHEGGGTAGDGHGKLLPGWCVALERQPGTVKRRSDTTIP